MADDSRGVIQVQKATTLAELTKALQISRATANRLIASGEIQSFKLGRGRRIPVAAIEAFIEKRVAANDRERGHGKATGKAA
jgi:excisionase family DNA binding protein